ncbi:MAG: hypothetical protein BJ554DRAFT_6424 [Olpidium bornovanus]|uniref:ENTH domain-containing protein n=1 Tax=Olpidium bornovanus TaxID=278681 RepID=A0A8H8DK69_9FUNG|nr:MAG: hypothetical protein BJ554DRAFT_6424 [Olpidium bornovanus]
MRQALTLLDYCLHSGSESVVSYARENLYIVKTLREFQYIDDELRDQGANGIALWKIPLRNAMRDRMGGGSGDYAPRRDDYGGDYGTGRYSSAEDQDLQRAIEESKKTALEHERKMMARANDDELRAALELSEREKAARERREAEGLFGGTAQPVTYDPFQPLNGLHGQTGGGNDLTGLSFGGEIGQEGFNQYQQQAPQQLTFGAGSSGFGNSVASMPATNQATNPFGASFGGLPIQNRGSTFGYDSSAGYSAASHFSGDGKADGASAGLNLARGNAQIDPFASVAGGRDAFGGGSGGTRAANNPFGSAEFSAANAKSPTEQVNAAAASVHAWAGG